MVPIREVFCMDWPERNRVPLRRRIAKRIVRAANWIDANPGWILLGIFLAATAVIVGAEAW